MRIGIYGGSFNPVHNGHIHLAQTAVRELELDRLYLVPSKISPHRSSDEYVSGEDRLEMLRLASSGTAEIEVSDFELKNDGVSYTVYTVEYFRRLFPQAQLFLLVGSDMLLCFEKWFRFRDIMSQAALCAVSRSSGDMERLEEKAQKLRKYGEIILSQAPAMEVSSTEIRKKIAKNEDFTCYLDKNVVQYIRSKELYYPR